MPSKVESIMIFLSTSLCVCVFIQTWRGMGFIRLTCPRRTTYLSNFKHRYCHTIQTGGRNWSGVKLCSDPTTAPGHRTDDNDDSVDMAVEV